jgi:hypothetical protein
MARAKRSSRVLPKAEQRLAGLKSIEPNLDMGKGCSISALEAAMATARHKLEAYNSILSTVDAAYHEALEAERSLSNLSEKMLLSVAVQYGRTSTEYEMAGGVRRAQKVSPIRQTSSALVS